MVVMVIIGVKKYDLQKLIMKALRKNYEMKYTALRAIAKMQ